MSGPYEIVRYTPAHKSAVVALQARNWSPDVGLTTRYLEWKYEENPYAREPLIYLAFHGETLVGMRGFYGARWEWGSPRDVRPILVADDLFVAPEHRNRGLVTTIMRAALEDLATRGHGHVFNLSGGLVTVLGSLAMGWKSAGPFEPVGSSGHLSVWRVARGLLRGTPFSGLADRAGLRFERSPFRRWDRAGLRAGSVSLTRVARPEAMGEIVERIGHDGRIRHVRDREFFAWRFRDPLSVYRFLYRGDRDLDGYLVLKGAHPHRRSMGVRIADLEGTHPAVRAELLDVAIDTGRFPELVAWATTLPPDARRHLVTRGFTPVNLEMRARGCPCVLVRSTASPGADSDAWALGERRLTDPANWDMRMLYTMAG